MAAPATTTGLVSQRDLLTPSVLMSLGLFTFGMENAAYDQLSRRMAWRHDHHDRFMARPASQFTGPGDDKVQIQGTIIPGVAGTYGAITFLIEMADAGESYPLMDGLGAVWGFYHIDSIDQNQRTIMAGGLPRMIDFSIELTRVE